VQVPEISIVDPIILTVLGITLLCIGPILLFLGLRVFIRGNKVVDRLQEIVADTPTRSRKTANPIAVPLRELSGSFMTRVFQPFFRRIGNLLTRLTPAGWIDDMQHKLLTAGNPFNLQAGEFLGIRAAFLLLGLWFAYMFFNLAPENMRIIISLVVLVVFFLLPQSWLNGKIRTRQDKIRKGMSDALDMVSVCMAAGLGFEQSLQRVSEHWRTPVGIEFGRVISEIEMGLSRSDALENMASRLDIPELSSFVSFITQAEKMGLSVSDTMHSQAEQMRLERRQRAQEQAQKIPVKMLIPMAFLIFPAIMAVILGPVIPSLMSFMSDMGG
jgi:tight adherence protein C